MKMLGWTHGRLTDADAGHAVGGGRPGCRARGAVRLRGRAVRRSLGHDHREPALGCPRGRLRADHDEQPQCVGLDVDAGWSAPGEVVRRPRAVPALVADRPPHALARRPWAAGIRAPARVGRSPPGGVLRHLDLPPTRRRRRSARRRGSRPGASRGRHSGPAPRHPRWLPERSRGPVGGTPRALGDAHRELARHRRRACAIARSRRLANPGDRRAPRQPSGAAPARRLPLIEHRVHRRDRRRGARLRGGPDRLLYRRVGSLGGHARHALSGLGASVVAGSFGVLLRLRVRPATDARRGELVGRPRPLVHLGAHATRRRPDGMGIVGAQPPPGAGSQAVNLADRSLEPAPIKQSATAAARMPRSARDHSAGDPSPRKAHDGGPHLVPHRRAGRLPAPRDGHRLAGSRE
ncbi:hypothetical protein BN12_170017 [Nostocoides japonicum T1-X7]|uniref:Uncharacterized protein n=1 Tax=Nostocoides japonicum T1-X7 TaxID=1194083 RepID=A0A077LUI1_9MICO|nr:hypothetical protein BN12_170017 [Tetrasphaera japonica T1-X7]